MEVDVELKVEVEVKVEVAGDVTDTIMVVVEETTVNVEVRV